MNMESHLLKLNLLGTLRETRKIYRYIDDRRNNREKVSPVWREMGDLITQNMKKAEVLHGFLALVFCSDCSKPMAQAVEGKGLSCCC